MVLPPFGILLISRMPAFLRILFGKTGIIPRRYVAEIAHYVHDLVIAQKDDNMATLFCSLLLQRHQEVHHFARLGPPVEEIARLHERRVIPRPVELCVNQSAALQDKHEIVEITVNIAHRHYGWLCGSSRGRRQDCQGEDREQNWCRRGAAAAQEASSKTDHVQLPWGVEDIARYRRQHSAPSGGHLRLRWNASQLQTSLGSASVRLP